ncbi:hypothetical protein FQN60_004928 [Etheostoma spectabile]|uniref:Ig-like domain-containing protein n=1 Tax=Etheostoma spectabile TaxID=54343 RepID=A0A5J5DL67_9PERO|nr:hypothetical protein FQN60_004928 [Etheostoma spectabile]
MTAPLCFESSHVSCAVAEERSPRFTAPLPPPTTVCYVFHIPLNGSLPSNVEIKNNTLFFKGPVTYDLAGTYVCDATNSIGTRTGIVDVNITGYGSAAVAAACVDRASTLAVCNDPAVEVKQYADASLTSESISVPQTEVADTVHGRRERAHCWPLFKAAALGLSNAS